MRNRFQNAYEIWNVGASNPRGVARALVEAIDQACEEKQGSHGVREDAAVQMILDHLCYLCGLPQPSLCMKDEHWRRIEAEVEAKKGE